MVRGDGARLAALIVTTALATGCAESTTSVTTGPSPAKCDVSLTGTSNVESTGGAGSLTVTTPPECVWTATASTTWITGITPTTGQGSGRIDFRVAANPAPAARDGEIVVNDGRLRVTQQAAATACTYTVAPATQSVVTTGGTGSITVTTGSGCVWSATSSAAWLTLTPANGSGAGTVTFTAAANTGAERLATVTVAGQQATVRQSGAQGSTCAYEIEPAGQSFTAAGGSGSPVTVTTSAGCTWTARTTDAWITVTGGASGTGSGTVSYTVAANTGAARTGTLTIAGETFTVSQAAPVAATCSFSIAPTSQSIAAAGGAGTPVAVTTSNGCTWTAASNVNWITVTSPATGSGNGSVAFTVAQNTALTDRSGTLTIAGHTFTVNQAATPCTFTITPTAANHDYAALNNQAVTVTASLATCTWTATSNDAWLGIVSGVSGSGNGSVIYNVGHNTGGARTGTLTIAGHTYTVYQAAQPACTYSLSSASANQPAGATTGQTVAVTPNVSTCSWSATSNASWLTITGGSSATGPGTVTYNVAANTETAARSGTLTIGGQTFTVNQAAAACTISINPTSGSLPAGATTNLTVAVTTNLPTCAWAATSNATAWLTIAAGASGTGSGTVTYNVAANAGPAVRIGALTIGGQVFTVTQATCSFTIAPTSANVPGAGGTGTVTVTANGSHCTRTALTNNAPWLTITSGASGTGSGTVNYTVASNGPQPRVGTLTVAGLTFTVNQTGN